MRTHLIAWEMIGGQGEPGVGILQFYKHSSKRRWRHTCHFYYVIVPCCIFIVMSGYRLVVCEMKIVNVLQVSVARCR